MGYSFLKSYAVSGRHYDPDKEISKVIASGHLVHILKLTDHDPNFTTKHVDELINSPIPLVRKSVAYMDKLTPSQISRLVNDSSKIVRAEAIGNRDASSEDLHAFISRDVTDTTSIPHHVINHRNINSTHIDKLITHPNYHVRNSAIRSDHATSEHVDKAVHDKHPQVRFSSIPKATIEQLKILSMDDNDKVRDFANMTLREKS